MKTEKLFTVNKYKISVLLLAFVFATGTVVTAGVSTPDVDIGSSGVQINTGTLDVNGNDIEDAGTTIWDESAGQIATGVVDYTAATASDVGLGNVQNENALAQDGSETLNGNWDVGSNNITIDAGLGNNAIVLGKGSLCVYDGTGCPDDIRPSAGDIHALGIGSGVGLNFQSDTDGSSGGPYNCDIAESNGDWTCDGTKSWRHELNSTHNAIYTSQESPEVRAVYEDKTNVEDGKVNVSLPSHFSKTVSDTRPSLKAQATPHNLANVAVTERTDDYIIIKASKDVKVDYRVTGIREGYEDKTVVREKQ